MAKIITNELIEQILEKRNFPKDEDYLYMFNAVQDFFSVRIIDQRPDFADYWIFTEATADGYEVWVTTDNPNSIKISEELHYYENDLTGRLTDAIVSGGTVYVEDLQASYVLEAVENLYEDIRSQLADDIVKELKEDGYDFE